MDIDDTSTEVFEETSDLLDQGRFDEALKKIDDYLIEESDHGDAHAMRSYVLVLLGELEAAEKAADTALFVDPDSGFAYFAKGELANAKGAHGDAIWAYEQALAIEHDRLDYLLPLASSYWQADRPTEARDTVERMKAIAPFDLRVLLVRAELAQLEGNLPEAKNCSQTALKLDPNIAKAHQILAEIESDHGDEETAVSHARTAHEIDPDDRGVLFLLLDLLVANEQHEQAVTLLDRAIERTPNDTSLHAAQGSALALAGEILPAKAAIDRALELDPDYASAYFAQALMHRARGDVVATIASLRRCLELAPNDLRAYDELDTALRRLGDKSTARETIAFVRSLEPTSADARQYLAHTAYHFGLVKEAAECLDAGLHLDPMRNDIRRHLAVVEMARGRRDSAIRHLSRLLESNPTDKAAEEMLGELSERGPVAWVRRPLWRLSPRTLDLMVELLIFVVSVALLPFVMIVAFKIFGPAMLPLIMGLYLLAGLVYGFRKWKKWQGARSARLSTDASVDDD